MVVSTPPCSRQFAGIGLILALLLTGCDSPASRSIGGGYRLEQWEDGVTYYLVEPGKEEGGGAIDGTVEKIGWDKDRIIAWRKPIWEGNQAGWMVIDIRRHAVSGPISEELRTRTELRAISAMSPAIAWSKLSR